jgi:hypothetical protein
MDAEQRTSVWLRFVSDVWMTADHENHEKNESWIK